MSHFQSVILVSNCRLRNLLRLLGYGLSDICLIQQTSDFIRVLKFSSSTYILKTKFTVLCFDLCIRVFLNKVYNA